MLCTSNTIHHGKLRLLRTLSLFLLLIWSPLALAAECTNVRLSGPPIWPPYVNGEDKGADRTGLAIDLVGDVFSEMGVSYEIDDAKPWARVLNGLEQGRIDIIFAIFSSPARQEKFVFTETWLDDLYAVITYKGREFSYETVDDLKERRGIVYHGVRLPPPLNLTKSDDHNLIEIPDILSLYKMLKHGRADYIIASPLTFKLLVPEGYSWSEFTVLKPSTVRIPIYMAFSKKSPCLGILDELNEKIVEHGTELRKKNQAAIFLN